MAEIANNKIIFDQSDFLSGMHPAFSSGVTSTPIPRASNQMLTFSSGMNPYRYFGYASPGFAPTDVTNVSVVTGTPIRKIVMAAESGTYYGYGINSGALVFEIDADTGALSNAGAWPHTITATSGAEEGLDVVVYSAKVGGTKAPRIFYSYNNNGATSGDALWDVGMYALDGSTFDDDFMTTAPATPLDADDSSTTSSASDRMPHPMIVGDDDILYIGDGNFLHGYDGSSAADNDGKFFAQVLTLPSTFRITAFAKYQSRLAIFGYYQPDPLASANPSSFYNTVAKVFWWDYLNLDPYDADDLNDNYVSCAVEYQGTIACFTQGRKPVPLSNQFAKMLIYNGSEFETVTMFDKNAPVNGGAEVVGDTIMWNSQGQIMQYGSPYPGFPNGLNKACNGSGTVSNGALRSISTTLQLASTGITTTGGLQKITSGFGTGSFATSVVQPNFPPGQYGRVQSVKIAFAATASGGRVLDLYLFGNGLAPVQILDGVSTIDSSNIVREYRAETFPSDIFFSDLALAVQWGTGSGSTDAPVIKSVEVTFEVKNIVNAI